MGRKYDIIDGKCVIPEGVTEILDEVWEKSEFDDPNVVFNVDSNLVKTIREIEIPDTLEKIGSAAFFYCSSLEEVVIPSSVKEIGSQAFEGCSKLKELMIENGVTTIEHSAFYKCSNLRTIRIPKSVRSIGTLSFGRCRQLETIEVDEDNPAYKSESNCCLTKDEKTLVFGCKSSAIPNGVTKIKDFAFYGCTGLKSIRIPDGVELIENLAFGECSRLTSFNIPESVKEIEIGAFAGCPLKDIYLAEKDPDACADLREGLKYNRLKNINLHVPEESAYLYKRHSFFKRFRMILSHDSFN